MNNDFPEPQDSSYPAQVLRSMRAKTTEELLEIWQVDDREAWTGEALQAVEKILIERLGALPDRAAEDAADADDESDDESEYPGDRKLIWIAGLARIVSWAGLAVTVAYVLLNLFSYFVLPSPFRQNQRQAFDQLSFVLIQATALVGGAFWFIVLQAINELIYLLMDIRELLAEGQPEG